MRADVVDNENSGIMATSAMATSIRTDEIVTRIVFRPGFNLVRFVDINHHPIYHACNLYTSDSDLLRGAGLEPATAGI